jgi:hypothetical protein
MADLVASALSQNNYYLRGRFRQSRNVSINNNFNYVADAEDTGGPKGRKEPPLDWEALQELLPDVTKYHYPMRNPFCEKEAVKKVYETQRFKETPLAFHYLSMAQEVLIADSFKASPPLWFNNLYPPIDKFLNQVAKVAPTKNPGYPIVLDYRTKHEAIEATWPDLYFAVCVRLLVLRFMPDDLTPMQLYELFAADPCSVSIKNEAIKIGKKSRVILAVPLVTELVERLLYDNEIQVTKRHWGENYSCIGIGFTIDDSIRFLRPINEQRKSQSDVPSFDASLTYEEEVLSADATLRVYGIEKSEPITSTFYSHAYASMYSLVIFSDGEVWAQTYPGAGKTGRFITSLFNTKNRARRSIAVDLFLQLVWNQILNNPFVRCAGDDCLEKFHDMKEGAYEALNFPLRDYKESDENPEFCSHAWHLGQRPVGKRIAKSFAKMMYAKDITYQQFNSFISEYDNHPEFQKYVKVLLALRPRIKSLMACITYQKCSRQNSKENKNVYSFVVTTEEIQSLLERSSINLAPTPSNANINWSSTLAYTACKRKRRARMIGPMTRAQNSRKQRRNAARKSRRGNKNNINRSSTALVPYVESARAGVLKTTMDRRASKDVKELICGITDPFCDSAFGAHYPDGQAFAIVPLRNRQSLQFTTWANGGTLIEFSPSGFPNCILAPSSFTTPNYTFNTAYQSVTGSTNFTSNFSQWRIVSAGMVIRNMSTVSNTSGYLLITRAGLNSTLGGTAVAGQMLYNNVTRVPVVPGLELPIISLPIGGLARDFSAFSISTTAQQTVPNWDVLRIEAVGMQANFLALDIEFFINLEMIPFDNVVYSQMVTPKLQSNPLAIQLSTAVQNSLVKVVHRSADALAGFVARKVMNYMVPGSAQAYSMISSAIEVD